MEDNVRGYRLDNCCSIFTAEAIALYRALQLIDPKTPHKYCIYTDSMSVLEAIENYNDRCHPVVCDIIDITSRLHGKGCDIQFCWIPSHVGITGNEQVDIVARSAATELPITVPLYDMKRVIQRRIDNAWQESWNLQTNNKLHCVKPVIGALPVMPMRRTDVKLTQLRIGHTRYAHRHLLLGENTPECPSCKVPYSVYHTLIDCPVFNHHRIIFVRTSILSLYLIWLGKISIQITLHSYVQSAWSEEKRCLKWIPSHGGVSGNETAGRGCDLADPSSSVFSHSEIHSLQRVKMNLTWRKPPAHYCQTWLLRQKNQQSINQSRRDQGLFRWPWRALESVPCGGCGHRCGDTGSSPNIPEEALSRGDDVC
ncbi:RNase H domain-containing protein [Trichonephila clavipes]|nr:RNase H domain-containing protein [Trichonephila clavipes]